MVQDAPGRRQDVFWRLAPVLAAVLAVAVVAASGFDASSLRGTALSHYGYGYFLTRQPLFGFAIVYGLARILLAGICGGGPLGWRLIALPFGAGLFLAACLYPTFGGLVLRAGFFAAAGPYLRGGLTASTAFLIGAVVAGIVYAAVLGLATILVRGRVAPRPVRRALAGTAALAVGAVILGGGGLLGVEVWGAWPSRPLDARSALASMATVAAALLPHALLAPVPQHASTAVTGT